MAQPHEHRRPLGTAQLGRLDRIAVEDPAAKVVGWRAATGPIVVRGDGRTQVVTPLGRTNAFGYKRGARA